MHDESSINSFNSLFKLSNKLGEGAHAQVYKCYKISDSLQETPYAVKLTREDDEEKRQAHKNEYAITSSLNHKNIVKSF